jgi:hypothetical protein
VITKLNYEVNETQKYKDRVREEYVISEKLKSQISDKLEDHKLHSKLFYKRAKNNIYQS